ncbi:hypothetical protein EVAR_45020_1 [Eumeta japonica]|uniref:Uncharacterized protein n=1 Tax=Eumeta variegata TaxID=151549 RepID=A0A4C1XFK5_EUMVA|nr:hypothetical protein EVAR_45020_1 [Eumeta japonica]
MKVIRKLTDDENATYPYAVSFVPRATYVNGVCYSVPEFCDAFQLKDGSFTTYIFYQRVRNEIRLQGQSKLKFGSLHVKGCPYLIYSIGAGTTLSIVVYEVLVPETAIASAVPDAVRHVPRSGDRARDKLEF